MKRMIPSFFTPLLFLLLLVSFANAQSVVVGKIIDSKTKEAIPFANVFVDNTTYGTVSEPNGEFKLKINSAGVYDLIVSFVGYSSYKRKLSVNVPELNVGEIGLVPSEIELNTVEVKGTKDATWEKKLKKFKKIFLGDDELADQCEITNPWIIEFNDDKKKLNASAKAPLEIENRALGYKVNFHLTNFAADATSYLIQGNARFEPLKSEDPAKLKLWEANREKSYYGSSQHLFKSMVNRRMKGEGFNVYADMLGFENSTVRSSSFNQNFNKTIVPLDTSNLVSREFQKDIYKISWKGRIEVHYRNEGVPTIFNNDIRYPVSWIIMNRNSILVNKDGVPLNPSDIEISGAMEKKRVAQMLPLDYSPSRAKAFEVVNSSAQITGKIVDSKTSKPIEGVEIFLNETTLSASSDISGQFELKCDLSGFHDLVLHKSGYSVYRFSMQIQRGRLYRLNLSLSLEKRKSKALTESENETVKKFIAGGDELNPSITIVNQSDLTINRKEGSSSLISQKPILVQDEQTGYSLKYFLMGMPLNDLSKAPVLFENLTPSDFKQNITWAKNREKFYHGSLRHWLLAALKGRLSEEGFSCKYADEKEIDLKTLVEVSSLAGYKKINISKPLFIHYQSNSAETEESSLSASSTVDVSEDGTPINPKGIAIEGAMLKRLADRLPLDYQPLSGDVDKVFRETMMRFFEKVYVHTDKPYYYPGETIWFKTYLNYHYKQWRDSLSKTLYVELIAPGKKKLIEKILRIDSSTATNDFILPDSLKEGNYYLRAYTSLNRNFGDSSLYVKCIPILNLKNSLDSVFSMEPKSGEGITITSNKKTYHTQEKITLTFKVEDENGKAISSNLSVSVTDVNQVAPISDTKTIVNSIQVGPIRNISNWKFDPENGFGLRGKFVNDKGKPEQVSVTIIQMKPRKLFFAKTDEYGIFSQSDLDFYDTITFAFRRSTSSNNSSGKFTLLPREIPSMIFEESVFKLKTKTTDLRQMIVSKYIMPNDSKMLPKLIVKGQKIREQPSDKVRSTYGAADATLTEKDINPALNILWSIKGKIAGLYVDPDSETIYFNRSANQSFLFQYPPLLMIDDVPVGANVGATLAKLNPISIESISFTKRLNVLYGSQENAGVISVYLKKGSSFSEATPDFQSIKVSGYSSPHVFRFPDYDNTMTDKKVADYRATIYWNPKIITSSQGPKSISFFAADLPGKYRVVAEGVTEEGEPVRGETYLDIDND